MGSGFRVLATFMALCIGFALVMGTVGFASYVVVEALDLAPFHSRHNEVFIGTFVCLLLLFALISAIGMRAFGKARISTKHGNAADQPNEGDTRMLQDLYRGFSRLEERVEALETILLDRADHVGASRKL